MARVRGVEGTRETALSDGWTVLSTAPGAIASPAELAARAGDACPALVPGTAASSLRAAGRWSLDDRVDFDARDWWWRCAFSVDASTARARVLRFAGLATLAEVWLNGRSILRSDDMFLEHEVRVDPWLGADNELVVCCRSLTAALGARRPRPRWKTRLVDAQQLRFFRTTLLGRIPAWSPPAAPVGPWRGVRLEERGDLSVVRVDARARPTDDGGVLEVRAELEAAPGAAVDAVWLEVAGSRAALVLRAEGARVFADGAVHAPGVARWWPHTHGRPARYPASLAVSVGGATRRVDLGPVAFRTIELDREGGGFSLSCNGVSIFCRGACWTPLDPAALVGTPADYARTLGAARDAGMNMIRVPGPFFYEEDGFYDACDELGVLVFQDYAFANMDYPGDDEAFVASVEREARGFLDRTQLAGCMAVLSGNSEVEQQAAMFGAPRAAWRSPLFAETLARASRELRPDVPYWPSTPSGGALPFTTDEGTSHYFGVGAYLRPLEDARRAGVRFATECLAFANVPGQAAVDALLEGRVAPHDPRWKRRAPRDGGAGWDFEDVRDHYLRELFGLDPLALRYADVARYLELSRVVTGEVMAATFAEWRRAGSGCAGALVWFLRDLWQGPGWGVIDADGVPKAAYRYLARVLRPVAVTFVDEGLNGLDVHVVNDPAFPLDGELAIAFLRDGEVQVAGAKAPVSVPARGAVRVRVAELLDHFFDATCAYRFGPPAHDVAVATLTDRATGARLGEAFHFPRGLPSRREREIGLEAAVRAGGDGIYRVTLTTRRLAQSVALEVPGFSPDDDFFHVAPRSPREVVLQPDGSVRTPKGAATPLNAHVATRFSG